MHNGMFRTLDEVIDFYNDTKSKVPDGLYTDTVLAKPLGLTEAEKTDIRLFLLSLTDKRFERKIQDINGSADEHYWLK